MEQTILITGASRGIGLELARRCVDAGWRVLACCRQPQAATELTDLVKQSGGLVQVHPLDVTDDEQLRQLSERLKDEVIDILFNNAGIAGSKGRQRFGEVPVEEWLELFRVNAIAPWKVAEAFVGQVERSGHKVIATMGSLLGSIADNGSGGQVCYRSSKAAAHMVAKTMAVELAPRGITSVVFNPGWVRTDMGGVQAPILPAESAAGLHRVLEGLTPADSGRFLSFEGKDLPW